MWILLILLCQCGRKADLDIIEAPEGKATKDVKGIKVRGTVN